MAGAITRHEVSVDRAFARHLEGLGKTLTSGLSSSSTGVNMKRKCEASYRVGNAGKSTMREFLISTLLIA